ncbi:hypothetical protein [Streptomyces sp. SID3212]|uniref:hypothetical protein n=1 Tax=unclassified Streptomyces TaxID=2593676 RepID=UPI00136FEC66|nr:hypothetical protein [Streptomyces sp. SID3212]MYV55597.1 hypothetical protein [Streptomyces sp. SID3212]
MAESVPVRCPACSRSHAFVPTVYPCACGAPVEPPLLRGAPAEPVTHRTWTDEWVRVRCTACGRQDHWPRPELGCPCGSVLRIPVREAGGPPGRAAGPAKPPPTGAPPPPRPTFRPLTIRTARDVVTGAALYLRWLGFQGVVQAAEQPASGIDLRGPDVVAQVDPTTSPASLRAVECLWLNGLNASVVGVFFALAGYATDARARADTLGVPLFVMDLTGAPQPVNDPADELVATGG